MNDPLDTMTLDRTANRARDAEMNSYAAYACEQGVTGIQVKPNCYGQQRNYNAFRQLAEEGAAIIERREMAGLKFYEGQVVENLKQMYLYEMEHLQPSDLELFGGTFNIAYVNPYVTADPIYLLYRQYNTGAFTDGRYPNTPLNPTH